MTLKRRQVLTLMGGGCAGLALGAGGLCSLGDLQTGQPVVLAPLADLPPGTLRTFPHDSVAVLHTEKGVAVLSTRCTHLGCNVRLVGGELVCPCHGGRYGRDGRVLAGPPPRPLPWLSCGVDAKGRIYFLPGRERSERRLVSVKEAGG